MQVALLPLALLGYGAWVTRMIRYTRRTGVSATVLASQYARWMQHRLGTRRDEACARLMAVLPNVSALGLRLVAAPTLLGHRLTGYVPRIYRYPYEGKAVLAHHAPARTTYFDAALARSLGAVDQLVVLGAGLDTRVQRLPGSASVRCFEVDAPQTQAFKRALLEKAGVEAAGVSYVPADFEHEDWMEKLVAAGFDREKPTFFLWESVSMYLDRPAVERTLRAIAAAGPGSVIAFDYLARELIEARSLSMRYARAILRVIGEPWTFGVETASPEGRTPDPEPLEALLEACGLTLLGQQLVWQDPRRRGVAAGFVTARAAAHATRSSAGLGTVEPSSSPPGASRASRPGGAGPDPLCRGTRSGLQDRGSHR
ncbi:MAG TPA: SAM-dependent methyltransferase [Polyangiaceae bacterium]|nr:SAM-dependent methyltransferase [Polyangiaceae bacterium]